MSRKRTAAYGSVIALLVTVLAFGLNSAGAATPAQTIKGVIGGDYHAVASLTGDDWGALASLSRVAALTGIRDADVAVVDNQAPAGVVSSDEGDSVCTGTIANPTAPPDEVCIYISNGDNAVDVHGVSIFPGTADGSKFGFKIVWSTPTDDADTFVEAVWAYQRPATT